MRLNAPGSSVHNTPIYGVSRESVKAKTAYVAWRFTQSDGPGAFVLVGVPASSPGAWPLRPNDVVTRNHRS